MVHRFTSSLIHSLSWKCKKQIDSFLKQDIIRTTTYSSWSGPDWVVPKKSDYALIKKWRLVIEYRKLNEKTITDKYLIPNINDILDRLNQSCYFSTLDLASGLHEIEMHREYREDKGKT